MRATAGLWNDCPMTEGLPRQADISWWMEEALAADPGRPCPSLSGDTTADVVILGGGYTGMWSAWFLKERDPGLDVVLLEQGICGGGPSGRNGGFCNALWEEGAPLIEELGEEGARRTALAAEACIAEIGAWCEENEVDAWFKLDGHLGVSTSDAQDGSWRETLDVAARLGTDWFVELSPEEVRARCESPIFRAGVLTPRAATLQPARLARGLRRVLLERGVRIYEHSAVSRFRGGAPVEVETPHGSVRAGAGVFALGAYAAKLRRFRRTILPRATYIILTEPIPDRLEELGWIDGVGLYDFRTALHYLRTTNDGRIAFGAASSRTGLGTGIGPRMRYDELSIVRLLNDFARWFPSLADVSFECAWGGPMDVTGLHMPFFGSLPPGNVHYGVGFTGGGVGPCRLAGKILSALVLEIEDEHTTLPLVGLEPKPFPPEPLRSPGAALAQGAIVRKDEAEDEGRRADPLTEFVARLPRRLGYNLGP
jgi:glycine/D-amino acid oxidase-like deaminating enzyme